MPEKTKPELKKDLADVRDKNKFLQADLESLKSQREALDSYKNEVLAENHQLRSNIYSAADNTVARWGGLIPGLAISTVSAITTVPKNLAYFGVVTLVSAAVGAFMGSIANREHVHNATKRRVMGAVWGLASSAAISYAACSTYNQQQISSVQPFQTEADSGIVIKREGGQMHPYLETGVGSYTPFSQEEKTMLGGLERTSQSELDNLNKNQNLRKTSAERNIYKRLSDIYKSIEKN